MGAHRGKNQPVPLQGIKAFCYGAPKVCPDFWGGAKNNQCTSFLEQFLLAPIFTDFC